MSTRPHGHLDPWTPGHLNTYSQTCIPNELKIQQLLFQFGQDAQFIAVVEVDLSDDDFVVGIS